MSYTAKIKLNFENMESTPSMLQGFYGEFIEKFHESVMEAENKIIQKFAEEEGLSLKCADYFIRKRFYFRIETITPKSIRGIPKFNLVLEPKSVEEILNEMDVESELDNECEKELIKGRGVIL